MTWIGRPRPVGRWVIACINWSYPDAPHALLARVGEDGFFDFDAYYPTHAEAHAALDAIFERMANR